MDPDLEEFSLQEVIRSVIFNSGWERLLVCDRVSDTLFRVRRRIDQNEESDFSESDVVGLFTEKEFSSGQISRDQIRTSCRQFLISKGML